MAPGSICCLWFSEGHQQGAATFFPVLEQNMKLVSEIRSSYLSSNFQIAPRRQGNFGIGDFATMAGSYIFLGLEAIPCIQRASIRQKIMLILIFQHVTTKCFDMTRNFWQEKSISTWIKLTWISTAAYKPRVNINNTQTVVFPTDILTNVQIQRRAF